MSMNACLGAFIINTLQTMAHVNQFRCELHTTGSPSLPACLVLDFLTPRTITWYLRVKVKVKVKAKVKIKVQFTLEQVMKAQRGSRGIALLFPYPRR